MSEHFPLDFEKRVKSDPFLGPELLDALNTAPPVTVRFHPKKQRSNLDILEKIQWCENGVYLKERPLFTLDPLFHAGAYYPQEAGSMVLDFALRKLDLSENSRILDLCAAPGGKSTLIASFLENKGLLVSNEVIQQRSRILRENLTKWGYSNTIVTNNDPKDFERLEQFFDVIVVDAPCSGEGMFRKDINAREEWSLENVDLCAARQKRIVMDVWDALIPGGYLVYSTCTFNIEENEENVSWFCEQTGAELITINFPEPITEGRNGIGAYCIPGKTRSEGYFIAVLRKPEESIKKQKFQRKNEFKNQKDLLDIQKFADIDSVDLINWNEKILALPKEQTSAMLHVQSQMRLLKMGTLIGEVSRKGILPNEELALNPFLINFQDRIDLDKQQALFYLHGDTFNLQGTQGYKLLTYEIEPLGWIKHLGNRFNNLFPKEWRIRMDVNNKI